MVDDLLGPKLHHECTNVNGTHDYNLRQSRCTVCNWSGGNWNLAKDVYCTYCGKLLATSGYICSYNDPCPRTILSGNCSTCGGDGLVDGPGSCSHSRYSTHSYCGHGRTGLHD